MAETRVTIQRLREGPVVWNVDLSPQCLTEGIEEPLRFAPARGEVTFTLKGREVLAEGVLESSVAGQCARCLAETTQPIRAVVHLYYWPEDPDREGSKIVDIDPDEPDFGIYRNDVVEPEADLREVVVAEAPLLFLCREDCRGLCSRCGADLNAGACGCTAEAEDGAPESSANSEWKKQLKSLIKPNEND